MAVTKILSWTQALRYIVYTCSAWQSSSLAKCPIRSLSESERIGHLAREDAWQYVSEKILLSYGFWNYVSVLVVVADSNWHSPEALIWQPTNNL